MSTSLIIVTLFLYPVQNWGLLWLFLILASSLVAKVGASDCLQGTQDVDLNMMPLSYGYRLVGNTPEEASSVSATGDVNGDGINDVLVGASTGDPDGNRMHAGITYVLFGKNTSFGLQSNLYMSSLDPIDGFRVLGAVAGDQSGFAVASGDVNGDNISDIIIGARFATAGAKLTAGVTYIIFGNRTRTGDIDLLTFVSGAWSGFRILGASAGDNSGSTLVAGDVNGNGVPDIIFGAPKAELDGTTYDAGITYVIFNSGNVVDLDLSAPLSLIGYKIFGVEIEGYSGSALCVCDVNGDDVNDVIIGAPEASSNLRSQTTGNVYVVFGLAGYQNVNLAAFKGNSSHGYRIVGAVVNDKVGTSVACGDVNGDGIGDIVIGATGTDPLGRSNSGGGYVVYGHINDGSGGAGGGSGGASLGGNSANATDVDLLTMATSNTTGYQIFGTINGDATGASVACADVNGDGINDVIIGATSVFPAPLRAYSGMVYVVYGSVSTHTTPTVNVDLALLVGGSSGYRISGIDANNNLGRAIATGDINHDGVMDIVIGAKQVSSFTGVANIVYGYNSTAVCVPNITTTDVDLRNVNGIGYAIVGDGKRMGDSVSSVGDVNGDGINDVIIGATTIINGAETGQAYVIFGGARTTNVLVASLSDSVGINIYCASSGDYTGNSVASGDVNNDGTHDIIVSAYKATVVVGGNTRTLAGMVYVIYGHRLLGDVSLGSFVSGSQGFRIVGAVGGDQAGNSVTSGDVNADGISDVIIGAAISDPMSRANAGSVYIVYGRNGTTISADVDLLTLHSPSTIGFRIIGAASGDNTGVHVATGDVNGDYVLDILIGASTGAVNGRATPGVAYVVYGKNLHANVDLLHITTNSSIGYRLLGSYDGDRFGISVGSGDVNNDGIGDIIVSAYNADGVGILIDAGIVYVVYGDDVLRGTVDLRYFSSGISSGFRIVGGAYKDNMARRVACGDVNNDGFSDIIIGGNTAGSISRVDSGVTYVVYGKASTVVGSIRDVDLQYPLLESQGYAIIGAYIDDQSGNSVSSGDVNNDGVADIITGAPFAHLGNKNSAGAVYVVYGVSKYDSPTSRPSTQPSTQPTARPTRQPSVQPTVQPAAAPTSQPSTQPSVQPSMQPTSQPTTTPTTTPSTQPSGQPSSQPSTAPTMQPSSQPTSQPSTQPSTKPSAQPSSLPSSQPSAKPSVQPTNQPTTQPTSRPSAVPSTQPSTGPTTQPSAAPTGQPSAVPSTQPTLHPTTQPISQPSMQPTNRPSSQPSAQPSRQPSSQPTRQPVAVPTSQPSRQPSSQPTTQPTKQPTLQPTAAPSLKQGTSEWVYIIAGASSVDSVAVVTTNVWVCGGSSGSGSGSGGGSVCHVVDSGGSASTEYALTWDAVTSILYTTSGSLLLSSMTGGASGVANCIQSAHLTCSMRTHADTVFVHGAYSQYANKALYIGTSSSRAAATIASTSSAGVSSVTYYYSSVRLQSMTLLRTHSPPQFIGSMVAGVGSTTTDIYILSGWVNLDSGSMNAYYIDVVTGNIQNSVNLVNGMIVEPSSADSIIVGGIDIADGLGVCMYVLRTNALYRTLVFGVRYRVSISRRLRGESSTSNRAFRGSSIGTASSSVGSTIGRGVVIVGSSIYMIADYSPPFSDVVSLVVLELYAESGVITNQVRVSAIDTSITCNNIVLSAANTLHISCSIDYPTVQSVVLTVTQALTFTQLPAGFTRTTGNTVFANNIGIVATAIPITKQAASVSTTDSTFVTSNNAPTYRPSALPTLHPTLISTRVPSAQPTSTPTFAPTVSPQPTSQPSSATPTNTYKPSLPPTTKPTLLPTALHTTKPSALPTTAHTARPTLLPTMVTTTLPTALPTTHLTMHPTALVTRQPSRPTALPCQQPTRTPTVRPTRTAPSVDSLLIPTLQPTLSAASDSNRLPSYVVGASVGAGLVVLLVGYMVYRYHKHVTDNIDRQKRFTEYMKQQTALVEASVLERERHMQREREQMDERKQRKAEKEAARGDKVSDVRTVEPVVGGMGTVGIVGIDGKEYGKSGGSNPILGSGSGGANVSSRVAAISPGAVTNDTGDNGDDVSDSGSDNGSDSVELSSLHSSEMDDQEYAQEDAMSVVSAKGEGY